MLADVASRFVPVQPSQELRLALGSGGGVAEPAERAAVGDDELARENPRRRRRIGEASLGGADPAVVAPTAPPRRFSAAAEQTLYHVHSKRLRKLVNNSVNHRKLNRAEKKPQ